MTPLSSSRSLRGFWACLTAAVLFTITGCGSSSKEDFLRRGQEFLKQGKLDDAALEVRKAIQKDTNFGEAYLALGQVLQQQGKGNDALLILQRAQQLLPASEEAKVVLGRLALDGLLALPQRPPVLYETATRMADQLLAANATSFEGLRLRAYLSLLDSKPGEAAALFEKALAAKPDQPDVVTSRVQALLQDRQPEQAEAFAQKYLSGALKQYGPLYDLLYAHLIEARRPDEAERLLRTKIDRDPKNAFAVIQLADHLVSQKKTAEADALLGAFVANTAQHPEAPLEGGDFYARSGRVSEALAIYQKGLAAQSDKTQRATYQQRIVRLQLASGKTAEAAASLEAMLKESPDDPGTLFARAALRLSSNQPADNKLALADLTALVAKYPDDASYRTALGRAQRQLGDERAARTIFQEVLTRSPRSAEALQELADLALRDRNPAEALQFADRALALAPTNARTRLIRTSAWAQQQRFGETRAELRRLESEYPRLSEVTLQLGLLNMAEQKFPEAERTLTGLVKNNDPRAVRALASLRIRQGQAQQGVALLTQDIQRTNNVETREVLVTAAIEARQPELALTTAQKLTVDFPAHAPHWIRLGQVHQGQDRLADAIVAFQKAESLSPADHVAPALLGEALELSGRYSDAVAAFRRALQASPNTASIMNNLAWNLMLANTKLDEALTLSQTAVKKEPENPLFTDTLGMIYLKSGKADSALQLLRSLLRKYPKNPTFQLHAALTHKALGQQQEARDLLESARKNKPSETELKEIDAALR
ncbi:MAG: tetratricopeptide repeat protein [Acidobacteria bacterium]|nr:tetratricopeptide repeat protein [Acidobacteriota bacterium]